MSESIDPLATESSRIERVGNTIQKAVRNTRYNISAVCGEAFDLAIQTTGEAMNKGVNGLAHLGGKAVRSVGTGTVAFARAVLGREHVDTPTVKKSQAA